MTAPTTVDTSNFKRAFSAYMDATEKELVDIVNKKAAIVAVNATRNTKRASREVIARDIGQLVTVNYVNAKTGKAGKRKQLQLSTRKGHAVPVAYLILNARRAKAGEAALNPKEMQGAARKMLASRLRSVGFLASGWLSALIPLLAVIKDKAGIRLDRSVKRYGKPKGTASPARLSWNAFATITNTIDKGAGKADAIISRGAQQALDAEAASMDEYVAKKLAKHHDKFNRA